MSRMNPRYEVEAFRLLCIVCVDCDWDQMRFPCVWKSKIDFTTTLDTTHQFNIIHSIVFTLINKSPRISVLNICHQHSLNHSMAFEWRQTNGAQIISELSWLSSLFSNKIFHFRAVLFACLNSFESKKKSQPPPLLSHTPTHCHQSAFVQ